MNESYLYKSENKQTIIFEETQIKLNFIDFSCCEHINYTRSIPKDSFIQGTLAYFVFVCMTIA